MKQEATGIKGDGSLEESNQPSYKEYEEESTVVFRVCFNLVFLSLLVFSLL